MQESFRLTTLLLGPGIRCPLLFTMLKSMPLRRPSLMFPCVGVDSDFCLSTDLVGAVEETLGQFRRKAFLCGRNIGSTHFVRPKHMSGRLQRARPSCVRGLLTSNSLGQYLPVAKKVSLSGT